MAAATASTGQNKICCSLLRWPSRKESCTLFVLSTLWFTVGSRSRDRLRQKIVRKFACLAQLILCCLLALCSAQAQVTINGTVRDATGAAVSGAQITLTSPSSSQTTTSSPEGKFSFVTRGAAGKVRVAANGFAPAEQTWSAAANNLQLTFVLRGVAQGELIVVSA